jgi:subfamily B ATP-binding cassette protein MsbA
LLIGGLVLLVWIALAAGALGPAVIALLTDSVLTGKTVENPIMRRLLAAAPAGQTGKVISLVLIWLGLQVSNDTITLLREMINNRLRYNGAARVRHELFDHLQELSPEYHKSRPQGDSIYRLSIDTQGIFGVLNTFIGAANSLLTLGVIGAVMLGWNARMTAVALGLTPLLVLANRFFGRTIRHTSLESKAADMNLTTFVQRAMASVGLVQLFGRQDDASARFRDAIDQTIRAGMRMNWQEQFYPLVQRIVYALGYAFILGYGAHLVHLDHARKSSDPFTVGGIFAMTFYLGQLWEPLRRITGFGADVQNNAAACARVFFVLDQRPMISDRPNARPLPARARTLDLRDVRFSYGGAAPILRGITARIDPGQMVAFIGPSGAGKSTLLHLLARFYDPVGGSLALDGVDLRDIRLADVRRHIALVPQDSPVVAGTVAENIAFGNPSATPRRIRESAELAGAAAFIDGLPNGYATELMEGGQNLSGGQRQRLAIARALLTDAPMLVLDEPTSGLDERHERRILDTLHAMKGHRTIILVTHRIESVTACDRIFVLQGGCVVECGTHEQLLAAQGFYAEMWRNVAQRPARRETSDIGRSRP